MVPPIVIAVGRLVLFVAIGFLIFRPPFFQSKVLPRVITVVLDVLFPFYFVFRFPVGWNALTSLPPVVPFLYFFLFIVTLGVQFALSRFWVSRMKIAPKQPSGFILLAMFHNTGFVPLPILEQVGSEAIILAMFFYMLGFNGIFWSVAEPVVRSGSFRVGDLRFRVNAPLVGMVVGFLLAITGWYRVVPASIWDPLSRFFPHTLNAGLLVLGGILAGLPRGAVRWDRDVKRFVVGRMVVYPAAMVGVAAAIVVLWPGVVTVGLALVLVLEAASPPATTSMVVIRAYGSEEQTAYAAGIIVATYLVSIVTIPLFVMAIQAILSLIT